MHKHARRGKQEAEKMAAKKQKKDVDKEVGEAALKNAKEEEAGAAAKGALGVGLGIDLSFLPGTCNCPSGAPGYSD